MTAADLLALLRARGIRVEVDGQDLLLRPARMVTPDLLEQVRRLKPDLLQLLRRPVPQCQGCGAEVQHHHVRLCQDCTWDEALAERLLRETLRRCAEAYDPAGPPWPPLPDPEPHDRAINAAWEAMDMAALRRALAAYEAAVRRAVEEHRRRREEVA